MANILTILIIVAFLAGALFTILGIVALVRKQKKKGLLYGLGIVVVIILLIIFYDKYETVLTEQLVEDRKAVAQLMDEWQETVPEMVELPTETKAYIEQMSLHFIQGYWTTLGGLTELPSMYYKVEIVGTSAFEALENAEKLSVLEGIDGAFLQLEQKGCVSHDPLDFTEGCAYDSVSIQIENKTYYLEDGQLLLDESGDVTELSEASHLVEPESEPVTKEEGLSGDFSNYHKGFYLQIDVAYMQLEALVETIEDGYFSQDTIDDHTEYLTASNETLARYNPPVVQTAKDQELLELTKELIQAQKIVNDQLLEMLATGSVPNDAVAAAKRARTLYQEWKALGI